MSVVEDALTAVSVGVRDNGVTMMHDATECGVWVIENNFEKKLSHPVVDPFRQAFDSALKQAQAL